MNLWSFWKNKRWDNELDWTKKRIKLIETTFDTEKTSDFNGGVLITRHMRKDLAFETLENLKLIYDWGVWTTDAVECAHFGWFLVISKLILKELII